MKKIEYLEYKTIAGDRWDLLAHKFYGNLKFINKIIDANKSVPIYERFPAGVELKIPVLEEHMTMDDKLPKWMKN